MDGNQKSFVDRPEWLAMSGFMVGVSFTMIAFHFNHKNILNESLYFWLIMFIVFLALCLTAVLRRRA